MLPQRPVNVIEATYNHLKRIKVAPLADYRMRRCLPAEIPCPECRYQGTIHYRMQDGQIVAKCDRARCVRLWLIIPG